LNIIFSLDGILRAESGEPIRQGVVLYYSLNNGNRVALLTSLEKADAEHWLKSHGIIGYDDLIATEVNLEGDDLKKRQFTMSRSKAPVEMYVDADPSMCAWVLDEQKISVVLFSHPSFAKVEHRPDAPKRYRTWDQIVESVDRANIARANDRMKPSVEIGEYSD
jgi:hypothetical protein